MDQIEHIVYLMLENRSLDNVLGWLYQNDRPNHFIPANSPQVFNGLNHSMYNTGPNGEKVYVSQITPAQGMQIPSVDPHEEFQHVQDQISNNMQGFYKDFLDAGSTNPKEIMECYTPESLPILNALAKSFAVSDAYFSSIPTQTNCNRAFSLTGNSIGWWSHFNSDVGARVNNEWTSEGAPFEFTEKTIWNVLADNGFSSENDWSVYYNQKWPGMGVGNYCYTQDLCWPNLQNFTSNFKSYDTFLHQAANGQLPTFSFLEPMWYEEKGGFGHNGNDYHPPAHLGPGEQFLFELYHALSGSPKWQNTLLIINFDEHGGTYDHVEPPAAIAPWADPSDGTANPSNKEFNFQFNQLGVRVPLILASPLIQSGTVFRSSTHIPFDHTSVIATILNHFQIPKSNWGLGSRTANAPTFENVVTLSEARTEIEKIPIPAATQPYADPNEKPNDLQALLMRRMITRFIQSNELPKEEALEMFSHLLDNMEHIPLMEVNRQVREIFAQVKNNEKKLQSEY